MSEPVWDCKIHPTDWHHEVGCPHRMWSPEELLDGLKNFKLKGKPLTVTPKTQTFEEFYKENSPDGT